MIDARASKAYKEPVHVEQGSCAAAGYHHQAYQKWDGHKAGIAWSYWTTSEVYFHL
tara:strand:- start:123 stop:290 length:168 start_codon:yes stop_codon:yes gene_type:complete